MGYYGDDSYTIDCVNCSMNHYHSNSYAYIVYIIIIYYNIITVTLMRICRVLS